jgi:hypothetical protein
VRETAESPDPPGRPTELRRPAEVGPTTGGNGDRLGSQVAARTEAEAASQAEFAKAMGMESGPVDPDGARFQAKYVEEVDPRLADAYDRIRNDVGDTVRISENTGIPQDKLVEIKDHIFFEEHDIAVGPDRVCSGNFTPNNEIADLWSKAEAGPLDPVDQPYFHRIMAHEYVESRLMNRGIPYRSADPAAWGPDRGNVATREHYGAHDLAPHISPARGPFDHWETLLRRSKPETTQISADLSNADSVVEQILRGI